MNRHKVYTVAGVLVGTALLAGACAGTASAMASGNGGNRIGVIQGSGTAHAKESVRTTPRTTKSGGVRRITPSGHRSGAVKGNGYAKAAGHNVTWSWGSTWGNQITPPGDWTGAVHGGGYAKGDGFSAFWSW